MKKIILTTLGTNAYEIATYQWQGHPAVQTRLFSAALHQWIPEAEVKVLLTPSAKEKNGELIKGLNPVPINIANGDNDDDNWQLFEKVSDAIPDNASVIFDVTHGFRSLPIVTLLALSYLRTVKNVTLEAVVYAAWDRDRPADDITPVFDLTPFVGLLDWAQAANRFKDTGDASLFYPLIRESENASLNGVAGKLKGISGALANNRTVEASNFALELLRRMEAAQEQETLLKHRPFLAVVENIRSSVSPLQPGDDEQTNLLAHHAQIVWYLERNHFVQAVGLAREWLISVLTWQQTNAIQYSRSARSDAEYRLGEHAQKPSEAQEYLQQACALWDKLTRLRNDLLHFGMRPVSDRTKSKRVEQSVKEAIQALPDAVRPLGLELPSPQPQDTPS